VNNGERKWTKMKHIIFSAVNTKSRIVSLFTAAELLRTAVGFFITLARQSGTRCQMNSEFLPVLMALTDSCKLFFPAATSVTSALEVF